MFTIGNDELEKLPRIGKTVACKTCGKRHRIKYGNQALSDGSTFKSDIAFYNCGDKTYLAGVRGKNISGY